MTCVVTLALLLAPAERPAMDFADTSTGRPFAKDPAVVRFGGRYLLYYSRAPLEGKWGIGVAESRDLVNWTKIGEVPAAREYERNGICAPGAIVLDGRVHLFYQTYGNRERDAICHAVSADGLVFERNPTNPILRPTGAWTCGRAIDADVVVFRDRLWCYWATRDPAFKRQLVGAHSAPLGGDFARERWRQEGDGPLLEPELPWERDCIEAPAAVVRQGRLYLFYAGAYNNEPQQIGVAVSDDGVRFERLSDQPFLANGEPGTWNASESGHPFLFADDDGRTYLFYQGNNTRGRDWYLSQREVLWRDGRPLLAPDETPRPTGLLVELLARPELTTIPTASPKFGWIVPGSLPDDRQTAWQIQVASGVAALAEPDRWDSGQVAGDASVNVTYAGRPLGPGEELVWRVRTWNREGQPSGWSAIQRFRLAERLDETAVARYPLHVTPVAPVAVRQFDDRVLLDFGRAAFGWLEIDAPGEGTVRLGEMLTEGRVNIKPGASIRGVEVPHRSDGGWSRVLTPADQRNTTGAAIKLPPELGVVLPFRYAEVAGLGPLTADRVRQQTVHWPFDDTAARFHSADDKLDEVWRLCQYSIKATTFCGVYVDGDRERIPYEADAYLNQLSHYAVDREFSLARYSHEYLLDHPTWPTEWKFHSVFMARADWWFTGNLDSAARSWDKLRGKLLLERVRADGLLDTAGLRDIVDWPAGERDGYDFKPANTVVNACWLHAVAQLAELAGALGRTAEQRELLDKLAAGRAAFQAKLIDPARGIFVDGEGSSHASQHANLFPLAFGLVPPERLATVVEFVRSKGMACSVYPAQYLLEGLYAAGAEQAALELLRSDGERSWRNMLRSGSTITLEAWDRRFKPNLDWNHAWGAAPANIIPFWLVGVRPAAPGWATILIDPRPGDLPFFEATVPTVRGSVKVFYRRRAEGYDLTYDAPANCRVTLDLPPGERLTIDAETPAFTRSADGRLQVASAGCGRRLVVVR